MPPSEATPVAIVGIGCLFPQGTDLASYWANILAARDCLSDLPADHSWSADDYYDPDPTAPDKTWATRGGFLDKVPFDPLKFGIPPAQLESIDTSQLLSLIVAREALRDAGIDPDAADWDRDRVACIVGVTGTQEMAVTAGARLQGPIWRKSMLRCGVDPALADTITRDIANHFPTWTEQTFPGLLGNVVAGRIANRLDLGGTNAVVDAACASSLAAIQYAIADLQTGRSDVVLTGGVDTLNDIFMFECFTRTPAFSKSDDARPFDASSDGILIGEGIALVALKRVADAERDGDRIYATIEGLGSSSDGRHRSIYAPNPDGQAKALRRTYAMAGIDPSTIELVEAHGTGTKAGDIAEVEALARVYGEADRTGRWVAMGSVKSQIGHTKSTAGAAGLVKVALALHQRVLPPTAKIDTPNPRLDLGPLYLNPRARPWVRSDHPRRAAVSAFGFGGSNFHAVLQEHGSDHVAAQSTAHTELFLVGAANTESLVAALSALDGPTVTHAARTALAAWQPGQPHVAAFTAGSLDTMRTRLATAIARLGGAAPRPKDEVFLGGGAAPRVAFVFPGQGSQYVEMGRTLAIRHPAVRSAFDAAERVLSDSGSLAARVFPPPGFTDDEQRAHSEALRDTAWAQPAIGALSMGMGWLLGAFNIQPDVVAGHSYGELSALAIAGALPGDALIEASRARGVAMAGDGTDRGTMAAVTGSIDALVQVLPDGVVLANRNHPEQGVISGPAPAVQAAISALADRGFTSKPLHVSAAFHSPIMASAGEPFRAALDTVQVAAPRIPVLSCSTAAPYPHGPDDIRDQLAAQITQPVDWVAVSEALADDGVTVVIECGPRGVLTALTQRCLAGRGVTTVAVDRLADAEDGDTQLKTLLAQLAALGVPIDPAPLLAERAPHTPRPVDGPATVLLGGANHREPATREPPMPDLPKPPAPPAGDGWGAVPSSGAPMVRPVHLERADDPEPATAAPAALGPPPTGAVSELLDGTRRTLAAFQEAQARTAEVHSQFLDAFARANDNFARLFEAQAHLIQQVATGAPMPMPTAPLVAAPVVAPPIAAAPVPTEMPEDLFAGATATATAELPPIFDAATALAQGKSTPKPPPTAAAPGIDLAATVLAAVAAKTGYPSEALELSMDLEADLGIDSIKRVEILAAVRESAPSLPELDNDRLSALRTLDDVIGALRSAAPAVPDVPVLSGPSPAALTAVLLQAVAEKTGYPTEALELSMDLESDLGIDSIKRVEILAAVRDAVPALPEIDSEVMAATRTLEQVASLLAETAGGPALNTPLLKSTPPPSRDAMVAALLASVAEKTGYPGDALELSMDLEADLGIDSIKRVEILSSVRDAMPQLPELDNDVLSSLRTLQDVADHLAGVAAGLGFALIGGQPTDATPAVLRPPAAPVPPVVPAAPAPPVTSASDLLPPELAVALARREIRVVPARVGTSFVPRGRWLVSADGGGRAAKVVAALSAAGADAQLINKPTAVTGDVAGFVHLACLGAGADAISAGVRDGFLYARALGTADRFVTVSDRGGDFGRTASAASPLAGALSGLAKTVAHEWPDCRALALDVAPDIGIDDLVAEILSDRGAIEVGLSDSGAVTLVEAPVPVVASATMPLSDGDLVVATGGGRGVTAACVIALAQHTAAHFLLLGRTPVPANEPPWARGVDDAGLVAARLSAERRAAVTPRQAEDAARKVRSAREIRTTLAAIEQLGATGTYAAVDARKPAKVSAAVQEAVASHGPVRGIVHGAGVLADRRITEKTPDQFKTVWSTKIEPLAAVLAASNVDDLRAVVLFTSVAGRRGNPGQVDYAMANEALVHWAHDLSRAAPAAVVKAIDWGPWDGGMVTASLKRHFEGMGHTVIPLQAGAQACADELRHPGPVEVLIEGPRPASGTEERTLAGTEPWLADHRIGEHPVLPAAMVLEWISTAAEQVAPGLRVASIRRFEVLHGVVLEDETRTVTLSWKPVTPAEGTAALQFTLSSPPGPIGLPVVHYRATAELTRDGSADEPAPEMNGLGAEPYPYEVGDAYRRFLFHGPALQGIDEVVGMSDHGAVAWVRTSRPHTLGVTSSAWSTDPLAVDSALQLMLLWVREKQGSCALPSLLGEYRQFRPLTGRLECRLHIEDGASATRGRFAAQWVDEQGRLVARLSRSEYTADVHLAPSFGTA